MRVRKLEKVFAYDSDVAEAQRFSEAMSDKLGIQVGVAGDLAEAARESEICVTCTTAREYFLRREYIRPGTFIAAVGADSEDKQELEPRLLSGTKIVADILEQSATIGELHHALEDGCVSRSDVYAELGEIVAGTKSGRTNEDEITVFDSTGMALQDVAAAAIVYERALEEGTFETQVVLN
jgi:ornithine cyclodeaminase/alanine dehydrogenase-like protein (mu-crystallin family)